MVSNIFHFHPYLGKWSHFYSYFSDGLKPPTRWILWRNPATLTWLQPESCSFFFPGGSFWWSAGRVTHQDLDQNLTASGGWGCLGIPKRWLSWVFWGVFCWGLLWTFKKRLRQTRRICKSDMTFQVGCFFLMLRRVSVFFDPPMGNLKKVRLFWTTKPWIYALFCFCTEEFGHLKLQWSSLIWNVAVDIRSYRERK